MRQIVDLLVEFAPSFLQRLGIRSDSIGSLSQCGQCVLYRCSSCIETVESALRSLPKFVVDDAQLGHLLDDPFAFRPVSTCAFAGVRIFQSFASIPNVFANVQEIVEQPRAMLLITLNR